MIEFDTFTVNADQLEDRIRLDAVSRDGTPLSVMFTRRLCDRFLPLFVDAVQHSTRPGIPPEIELAMAQEQLRQERSENPLPDVILPEAVPAWLCRTIHLEQHVEGLLWRMTDEEANDVAMPLGGDGPRSVLEVFLQMYRHLEWDEAVFPAWLREGFAQDATPRTLN